VQSLQTLDLAIFRFINAKLANPVFDQVMPWLSGNALFYPLLFLTGLFLIWKCGRRGLVFVALLALIVPMGDGWISRSIKRAVERPRPYAALSDVRRPGVKVHDAEDSAAQMTNSRKRASATGSMPSSHAANWFAAAMVAFVYYRRTIWFMLPAAMCVAFSRVYNGVHYPSDVFAGAVLGAGYAAAGIWCLDRLWLWAGRKWFPIWWKNFPSIVNPDLQIASDEPGPGSRRPAGGAKVPGSVEVPHGTMDLQWLRLGYIVIAAIFVARLFYIAGDSIQLSGDEAYQWVWSKHLALSYYSKPPIIAYAQFLGTALFGDNEFGVRFLSPVSSAILGVLLLRFFAREFNARAGFSLVLIGAATPLLAAGGVLMTIDVFSVLFWGLAMLAGWRAVQPNASTGSWLWVGLWMGLGFLSKYTALFQWLCWAVFFVLWPPARRHLRTPGPWLALLVNVLCSVPVLIWNYQHDWITISHVASNAKAGEPWSPAVLEFLGAEFGLLNPVFFVATVWAAIALWRRRRHNPILVYLFCMGAPLFLVYFLWSFHSRIFPNWIAPSVLPLFCLMVGYWDAQWRLGLSLRLKRAVVTGCAIGLPLVIIAHDTEIIGKLTGHYLPIYLDPLHRARGWKDAAALASDVRRELLAEGKPVFFIAGHYRVVGELSFYLPDPEAKTRNPPLVYCRLGPVPVNQFYFWPGYTGRKGENAIFIVELNRNDSKTRSPPEELCREFESVTNMGVREVLDHNRVLWRWQFFACRGLR
jgi:membrane-associated phospholipid phosphatase